MKIKSAICLLLAAVLIVSMTALTGCSKKEDPLEIHQGSAYRDTSGEYDSLIKSNYEFYSVAENDSLELFVNGSTAEIKVVDKATGAEWFSNPQDRYDSGALVGASLDTLTSQVVVQYDVKEKSAVLNTCNDAVWKGQYCFEEIEDGIRVNFLLGEKPKVYYVPQIISLERYDEFVSKMTPEQVSTLEAYYRYTSLDGLSKTDQAVYSENYPVLKERDVYIALLTSNLGSADGVFASDYLMNQLNDMFTSIGYTEEMFYADNEANGVGTAKPADTCIGLSVVYSIAGGEFTATIPYDSITYDSSYLTPMNFNLLPYFGCADQKQEGYIMVPDGSGALINLNNQKQSVNAYNKRVYGQDYSVSADSKAALDIEQIYLPVFGMRQSNADGMQGFLAVIEEGDALAEIQANISGKVSAFNVVSSTFHMNQTQKASDQTLGVALGLRYQKQSASSNYSVRYLFLDSDKADYTGMANRYREYLLDKNGLNKAATQEGMPLYVSTIGAVDTIKTVAGIPVESLVPLTTYEQNTLIMQQLQQAGVENLLWNTDAWCNNGVKNTAFTGVSALSALGGNKGYNTLLSYAKEKGIPVFSQTKLQAVAKDGSFDGFTASEDAARNLENATAYESDYSLVTRTYDEETRRKLVSPHAYSALLNGFLKDYAAYGNGLINLGTLGYALNGDYNEDNFMDRQQAKTAVSELLAGISPDSWNLSADGGNAYALGALDFIYNLPTQSSREYLFDATVPFYQMVVRGHIPYAGRALNLSSEYDIEVLRLIETGTIPSFQWIYEANTVLKNTDYNYYSVNYRTWMERAQTLYAELNTALEGVAGAAILRHEIITDDVVCTTYEGGVKIYVNYGDSAYKTADGTVKATDYLRVG